jgi:LEA14-like dessication related protein
MWWLQRNLLTYEMPSWSIEIDGTATTSAGIQKGKKQTLSFPVGVNNPNMMQLVKTYIGNGQFDKLSINLSSRTAKVTLKYNTYDN